MARCTYPRNETLVQEQLSLHQLQNCHPSQRLPKQFFSRTWCHVFNIPTYEIIATCIEHATALRANNMRAKHEYTSVTSLPCYPRLIYMCTCVALHHCNYKYIFVHFGLIYSKYCSWTKKKCTMSLTSACSVHSNVYCLDNISCIMYLTAVDPILFTSSTVQNYHHMLSSSVKIPHHSWTGNSRFIGKKPIPLATSSPVSYAEQGSIVTCTNVLQCYETVVLVCCTIEWEPDITCNNTISSDHSQPWRLNKKNLMCQNI